MERPILYLLGAYPVWSETFLRQDLRFLLAAGIPLIPVSLFPGDTERLPRWPEVRCLQPGKGARQAAGARRRRQRLPRLVPRRLRTWYSLWRHRDMCVSLARLISEHGAGHIHGEFADLPGLLAAKTARHTGISHSLGIHARDVHLGKYDARLIFTDARFVTSCNQAALDSAMPYMKDAEARAHLIYHGLDMSKWPYEERPAEMTAPGRLLFVGRFVEKKGLDILLEAVGILADRDADTTLTLVGDGPLRQQLQRLAQRRGIADRITWTGVVDAAAVRGHLAEASCLVTPSRIAADGDRDGIPNVVLEAMATGTPVVGTAVGGLGEVLTERTGWVVSPENPGELADRIQSLRNVRDAVETRRGAARRLLENRFDAKILAKQRARLFREACGD